MSESEGGTPLPGSDGAVAVVAHAPPPPLETETEASPLDKPHAGSASASPADSIDGLGEVGLGAPANEHEDEEVEAVTGGGSAGAGIGAAISPVPPVFVDGPVGLKTSASGTPIATSGDVGLSAASASPAAAAVPATPASPFDLVYPTVSSAPALGADYARVAHSWVLVSGQLATGLEALKHVAEFVRKVAEAKQDYSAQLMKTSSAYASKNNGAAQPQPHPAQSPEQKDTGAVAAASAAPGSPPPSATPAAAGSMGTMLSSLVTAAKDAASAVGVGGSSSLFGADGDAMGGASRVWIDLREHLFDEARQEAEYARQVLAEVVTPLLAFYHEATRRAKVLSAHHAALAEQMRAMTEGKLLQAKIAAVKAVSALHAQEAREREWAARMPSAPTSTEQVPPPPVHTKSFEAEGGLLVLAGGKASSAATTDTGKGNTASSTKRAMASVGSWFKNLGKKDKEKEKEKSDAPAAAAAAPDASAAADAGVPSVSSTGALAAASSTSTLVSSASSHSSGSLATPLALASQVLTGESSEELREKAYAACLGYEMALQASNARQEQFFLSDLPLLFAEAQRLEVARLNALKHYLTVLSHASLAMTSPAAQRAQSLLAAATAIQGAQDTKHFAESIMSRVGAAQRPNAFRYDLQHGAEEIRRGQIGPVQVPVAMPPGAAGQGQGDAAAAASDPVAPAPAAAAADTPARPSVFGSSLAAQMDLADSDASLAARAADPLSRGAVSEHDVPPALHALLEALKARKGSNKLTLFSGAAPVVEVERIRSAFDSGDFSQAATEGASVEVLAAALKAWMRALPEPLLPSPLYNAAIQSIKKDAAAALAERHAQAEAIAAAQAAAKEASANANAASSPANAEHGAQPVQSLDGIDRPKSSAAAAASPAPSVPSPSSASASSPSSAASPRSSAGSAPLALPPATLSFLPSPQLAQYCSSIYSALPTLNQRVIAALARIVNELATAGSQMLPHGHGHGHGKVAASEGGEEDPNGPVTDWQRWAYLCSMASLPFVPSFLRMPPASAQDAVEKSAHAKLEARFVAAMIMTVAQVQAAASASSAAAASSKTAPFLAQPAPVEQQSTASSSAAVMDAQAAAPAAAAPAAAPEVVPAAPTEGGD